MRELLARDLERARVRTLRLTDLDEPELVRQHDPLMSPLVWDLAHIGQQEDLWLLRGGNAGEPGLLPPDVEQLYDAFKHRRSDRPSLPLLPPVRARSFCTEVRGRVLDRLERADEERLFPYGMVVQHEQQHDETMLAALQLRQGPPVLGPGTALPSGRPLRLAPVGDEAGAGGLQRWRSALSDSCLVPASEFVLGVDLAHEPFSLDNERPAHVVHVPAFRIGRVPVTNAQWREFIADGGYQQPRWWSGRGWQHRVSTGVSAPMSWLPDGSRVRFGLIEDVPPDEPVQHVSYFEAQAFAAWAGARLPTEVEWEKACAWDPVAGQRRRWPWGSAEPTAELANLGGDALRPASVGAYPAGASAYGVEQLIGEVWEWTSSPFVAYPGFSPMLYDTYSSPFFGGDFRVLRGGSWAVAPSTVRPSFRNWDLPVRRQIFTGLRLAWDA
ncbi:ergothioneine biosynthesis protein EgtB [Angustibacter sp. McL0619]|uniref:ergothioneine biosynthesis protein EgtB n=1 Tax=Angustibacter sp. McL0619 TaxID=3415676 RepID=UPI003CF3F1D5